MTIEILRGNLLEAFENKEVNVIGHVVNCQKKMNSGIAKAIREAYPDVYDHYMTENSELGKRHWVELPPYSEGGRFVCNLYAQFNYGYDGKRYLNYAALAKALQTMANDCGMYDVIGFPYKMGSDRAASRGQYPIGVCYCTRFEKFISQMSRNGRNKKLGSFDTEYAAQSAYKLAKEDYVKEVANKYKELIDPRVYNALMIWEVDFSERLSK